MSKDRFYSWLGLKGLRHDMDAWWAGQRNRVPSVRVHTLGRTAQTVVAAPLARLIVQSHFHNKKTQSANSSTAFGRETSLWVLHTQRRKKLPSSLLLKLHGEISRKLTSELSELWHLNFSIEQINWFIEKWIENWYIKFIRDNCPELSWLQRNYV